MPYYDYEGFYEPSEFDEKIEEFKDYLRESVKQETKTTIDYLKTDNDRLKEENKKLQEENDNIVAANKSLLVSSAFTKIMTKNINKDNIFKVIEAIFPRTFNENITDCNVVWGTYVNYYNNKEDVITLLKSVGIAIPSEIEHIILPHEWDGELLDQFFSTMGRHYNCNGRCYEDNLRYWSYKMASNPFDVKYSSYDDIPWQFVLRNPLLNSEKYATRIAAEMSKGGNGIYFSRICKYQDLDADILKIIVDNTDVPKNTHQNPVLEFLIDNIGIVTDKQKLDELYPIIVEKWGSETKVLKMPKEYQIKYVQLISSTERKIAFLNKTKLSKDEKATIIGELLS